MLRCPANVCSLTGIWWVQDMEQTPEAVAVVACGAGAVPAASVARSVAVVTGAGRRVGAAIAIFLARRGLNVVVH